MYGQTDMMITYTMFHMGGLILRWLGTQESTSKEPMRTL